MTLLTENPAPGSVRTRRRALVGALCALTCMSLWQFVMTGLKVADAQRVESTGQIPGYNEYMLVSAQHGLDFILADYTILSLCYMKLGPLMKSNRVPAALLLVFAIPPAFYSVWQFYQCQRDIVMETVANECMSHFGDAEIWFAGMFSFTVKCAEMYPYDGHVVDPLASRLASFVWLGAMTGSVVFFLMMLIAVIRRPAGPALLTGEEDHKLPDEEAQKLLEEKV